MESNYPCKCGHSKNAHWYMVRACTNVVLPFAGDRRKECDCQYFEPDNLRYLEQQVGQQQYDKNKKQRTKRRII